MIPKPKSKHSSEVLADIIKATGSDRPAAGCEVERKVNASLVTSTKVAPWHVVPADDKWNAQLIISRVVIEAIKSLSLSYAKSSPERRRELLAVRQKLAEE